MNFLFFSVKLGPVLENFDFEHVSMRTFPISACVHRGTPFAHTDDLKSGNSMLMDPGISINPFSWISWEALRVGDSD